MTELYLNPNLDRSECFPAFLEPILSEAGFSMAQRVIASWPGYQQTPMRSLDAIAKKSGIGGLWYKDESRRFGLGSFKALGGAYAVHKLVEEKGNTITVTTATDGNHGRSVAWGAAMFDLPCVVYVHEGVSIGRKQAIEAYGASVVTVAGNYDDTVRRAAEDAARNDWFVVSDTSYEGYNEIPRYVMQGYTLMVEEALSQLSPELLPTHVFVQGGVGAVAAAVCAHSWYRLGADRPSIVVVEPENAACLLASAKAGVPMAVKGSLETMMAGLACGETSLLAWDILMGGATAFMTIGEDCVPRWMNRLANGEPAIEAGESAVAGVAGLEAVLQHPAWQEALKIGSDSWVLVFGTEGATDPKLYRELVRGAQEGTAAQGTLETGKE